MFRKDKIILRPIIKNDLEKLNKWKNDEEVYKYLGGGFNPISIDQHSQWIDKLIQIDNVNKRFIIEYDGQSVGMIGLYSINNIHQNCEIGLYIGERDYRGRGIAKTAIILIEEYAKKYLNLKKIKLFVVEENLSAKNTWMKSGFDYVGTLKKERYIDGEFKNLIIMEKFI